MPWGVVAAVIAVGAGWAFAQARSSVQLSTPGQFRGLGDSNSVATFRSYSYGLGALQAPAVTSSSNPLRSAIESAAVFDIARPGGGGVAAPVGRMTFGASPTGSRLYQPLVGIQPSSGGGYGGASTIGSGSRLLKATSSYLNTLSGGQGMGIATRVGPITSLASGESDQFSTYMSQGEKAFRAGDYEAAMDSFQSANGIDPKNPESLLSLVHTSFAMSRASYFRTSYYLARAIKFLPELPLAPLEPKSFFPSQEAYKERLGWLDKHLAANPFDNDAFFVSAYFRWFDGDVDGARQALAKARRGKIGNELTEAIDTFWDGMKASGKVSGTLDGLPEPSPAPAPTSQPTPAEPPSAEPSAPLG